MQRSLEVHTYEYQDGLNEGYRIHIYKKKTSHPMPKHSFDIDFHRSFASQKNLIMILIRNFF